MKLLTHVRPDALVNATRSRRNEDSEHTVCLHSTYLLTYLLAVFPTRCNTRLFLTESKNDRHQLLRGLYGRPLATTTPAHRQSKSSRQPNSAFGRKRSQRTPRAPPPNAPRGARKLLSRRQSALVILHVRFVAESACTNHHQSPDPGTLLRSLLARS